ncbi:MAG: hypothetical protein JWN70_4286 [Planctomycetaceae bacterium]|nr:hypothetical protein [Planctomycetaceae bacterium]
MLTVRSPHATPGNGLDRWKLHDIDERHRRISRNSQVVGAKTQNRHFIGRQGDTVKLCRVALGVDMLGFLPGGAFLESVMLEFQGPEPNNNVGRTIASVLPHDERGQDCPSGNARSRSIRRAQLVRKWCYLTLLLFSKRPSILKFTSSTGDCGDQEGASCLVTQSRSGRCFCR